MENIQFGVKVISGMNLIDRIPEGRGQNGQVFKQSNKNCNYKG